MDYEAEDYNVGKLIKEKKDKAKEKQKKKKKTMKQLFTAKGKTTRKVKRSKPSY